MTRAMILLMSIRSFATLLINGGVHSGSAGCLASSFSLSFSFSFSLSFSLSFSFSFSFSFAVGRPDAGAGAAGAGTGGAAAAAAGVSSAFFFSGSGFSSSFFTFLSFEGSASLGAAAGLSSGDDVGTTSTFFLLVKFVSILRESSLNCSMVSLRERGSGAGCLSGRPFTGSALLSFVLISSSEMRPPSSPPVSGSTFFRGLASGDEGAGRVGDPLW